MKAVALMMEEQAGPGAAPGPVLVPLALPSLHRPGGWIDPAPYRLQAAGEQPLPQQNLSRSSGLRTIQLSGGVQPDLFAGAGDTLNLIVSGELQIARPDGTSETLASGDVLLVRSGSHANLWSARGDCRLVQLGVDPDWPGPDAALQDSGSPPPAGRTAPNLRRMDTDSEGQTRFSPFANLFPAQVDCWSPVTPVRGFRFLRFPDGAFIDWHPEVVNNLAVFLSGEMEIEIGGGLNGSGAWPIDHFVAGDVLLAADRTGQGHIDRMHGVIHMALIVLEDDALWNKEFIDS